MCGVVRLLEATSADVGVDLRRRELRVSEHHLDRAEIRAAAVEAGLKLLLESLGE